MVGSTPERMWIAAAIAVLLALGAWFYFPVWHGDAAIYLPYVRALWERGRWMEFNPGERSSGATSPLWLLWLVPWWGLGGATGFKLAGAVLVIGAVVGAYLQAVRLGASSTEALLVAAVVAYCVVPAGFLGYETPLVALVGIAWVALFARLREGREQSGWAGVLAALSPVVRPELGIMVAAAVGAALLGRRWRLAGSMLVGMLLPIAYYVLMHVLTGNFSASGYCRSFALRETAEFTVAGLRFHRQLLLELLRSGLVIVGSAAAVGVWHWRTEKSFWVFGLGVALGFGLFFTVVAPLNTMRYAAPVAFLFGYAAILGFRKAGCRVRWLQAGIPVLALLIFLNLAARAWDERRRGWTFDRVTERECAELLNGLAQPGESVLAYEVQIRYWLRPELSLLSLDGVTDGRIAPYLASGDIVGFLRRYRPQYWVANEAVWRRPFLRRSLLAEVLQQREPVVCREGICFERLWQRAEPSPRGFYGCLAVYRLRYGEPP
ncbi:hypothetical protein HRbin21_00080 [bacterium HR21]|nr:hypothetical protein HRbin21_00080 [bacterium HR21]